MTWLADTADALRSLGGRASMKDLEDKVREIRFKRGNSDTPYLRRRVWAVVVDYPTIFRKVKGGCELVSHLTLIKTRPLDEW